jgi:hypothetical protein
MIVAATVVPDPRASCIPRNLQLVRRPPQRDSRGPSVQECFRQSGPVNYWVGLFILGPQTNGRLRLAPSSLKPFVFSVHAHRISISTRRLVGAKSMAGPKLAALTFQGQRSIWRHGCGIQIVQSETNRKTDAVNGGKARGGSLDGGGPAVVGGMVYVNFGYGTFGGMPGKRIASVFGGR